MGPPFRLKVRCDLRYRKDLRDQHVFLVAALGLLEDKLQLQRHQEEGARSRQGQQSGQQSRSQESAVQLGQQGSQRRSQQRRDR